MTFQATVAQLLLSGPGDLDPAHREVVIKAIRTWNNSHGRRIKVMFSPTNWEEGSSPEYGIAPQDSLNRQVVDSSDLGLVIFTDRLGTPTDAHPSGTVEEIERLHAQGKRVAILRNLCQRVGSTGTAAAEQKLALEKYLTSIQGVALYREYESLDALLGLVTTFLNDAAYTFEDPSAAKPSADEMRQNDLAVGVWPSVESEQYQETDSKGRLKTKTKRYLVLKNETGVPVTNVSFTYLDAEDNPSETFDLRSQDHDGVAHMGPGASHHFPILQAMGSPDSAMCVVAWTDPTGAQHETRSTVTAH